MNVIDLSIIGRGYGAMKEDVAYEEEADLSSDRIIDLRDLGIVAIHLGETDS